MSDGPSNLERRQKALQAVRRHVRRLEIETHRVKAHLARLEADYEEDIADWMSRKLRRRSSPAEKRINPPHNIAATNGDDGAAPADHLTFLDVAAVKRVDAAPPAHDGRRKNEARATAGAKKLQASGKLAPPPQVAIGLAGEKTGLRATRRQTKQRTTVPPLIASAALHAAGLLFCISFGYVTIIQQAVPLFASPSLADETVIEEFADVKIEPTKFDDDELQNVIAQTEEFNVSDSFLRDLEPTQLGAGSQALGDIGQLDALPSDLSTLMAGAGSPGSGPPGGERGAAVFFGARSQGDRFVFVVDNSSSMKDGRLEAAIAELIRSVDALSPRQGFYVIFVSDQIYPMFYPQAAPDLLLATLPNKQRLAEWLPRAATASGKNRELIKAMNLAASLRPHAVFFLWDGRMDHAGVRQEVMAQMTRPNQWAFPIHTFGMGVDSLDSEYNLSAIAHASGGTFRRVDVPAVRSR
jgi:von Willebrand factor type A domain